MNGEKSEQFQSKPFNTIDELTEEFFRWMEYYHPDEKNSYQSFRHMSKRRLEVMILEYLEKIKNK